MNGDTQLFAGQVMHRRLWPMANCFVYPVSVMHIKLSTSGRLTGTWFGVDCLRPLPLCTRDYGPRDDTDPLAWICGALSSAGLPADDEVRLQAFPRIVGWMFNLILFWCCHGAASTPCTISAGVNNTFGQHYQYLLCMQGGGAIDPHIVLTRRKQLHVSPFYRAESGCRFRSAEDAAAALVRIDYHDRDDTLLHTAIGGRSQPFDSVHLRCVLLRQPLLAPQVISRIHW